MKVAVIVLGCLASAAVGIFLFVRFGFGNRDSEFPELYMEGRMQRTPKLQEHPEVQRVLAEMKQAGLCGLMYNVRVAQTVTNAKLGLDCAVDKWIRMSGVLSGSADRPFVPYGIHKFAILPRDGELVVVTEGARGQNTFDELAVGIPKVTREAIAGFATARENEAKQRADYEKKRTEDQKRQDEVNSSFSK
jgi:hypothetical protein